MMPYFKRPYIFQTIILLVFIGEISGAVYIIQKHMRFDQIENASQKVMPETHE